MGSWYNEKLMETIAYENGRIADELERQRLNESTNQVVVKTESSSSSTSSSSGGSWFSGKEKLKIFLWVCVGLMAISFLAPLIIGIIGIFI